MIMIMIMILMIIIMIYNIAASVIRVYISRFIYDTSPGGEKLQPSPL